MIQRTFLLIAVMPFLLVGGTSVVPLAGQEVDYANHFRVYTSDGVPASLSDVARAMGDVDAVLVGEDHTDPVGHWIEAELLRMALADTRAGDVRPVALSLEMFERDVQGVVDEYLQDLITEGQFKASARPWKFYDADYRAMVELAKEAGIAVIAANAPRRYVNRVTRLGRDALSELPYYGRSFLPPLPFPEPSDTYREEWLGLMAVMPMERQCIPPGGEAVAEQDSVAAHPTQLSDKPEEAPATRRPPHMGAFLENGLQAQALWDASMAHAIATHLDENPTALVLHMVGGFHVENLTGTPEQLQYYRPGTSSLVVLIDNVDEFESFDVEEHAGKGDFVILTDRSLDLEYERFCVDEEAYR